MHTQHPNSAAILEDSYLSTQEAQQLYLQGDAAHDFDHVLRVTRLAIQIAQAEGADPQIVRLAALLHDVPVNQDIPVNGSPPSGAARVAPERISHHLAAAAFARQWLQTRGMGTDTLKNVVHAIEAHRFRDQSIQPATLEAKCLYDADKLDSIGAIGIGRAFAFAGAHGSRLWTEAWTAAPDPAHKPTGSDYTPVHEYIYKLRRILPSLHTETARRIAAGRHAFMAAFFDQLDAEMQGDA